MSPSNLFFHLTLYCRAGNIYRSFCIKSKLPFPSPLGTARFVEPVERVLVIRSFTNVGDPNDSPEVPGGTDAEYLMMHLAEANATFDGNVQPYLQVDDLGRLHDYAVELKKFGWKEMQSE